MTGGLGRRGVRRSLAAALAVVLLGSLLAVVPVGLPLADGPSEAGAQQVASQAVLNRVTIVEGQTREFAISNVVSRPAYFVHVSVAGSFTAEAGDVRVTTDNRRGQAQVITPDADAPRAYRHSTYGTVAFEVTANADSDGAGDETFGVRLCTTADCAGGTVLGEWTVTVTEPAADTTLSGTGATLTIRGGSALSVMEHSRNRDSRDRRATFEITLASAPTQDIVVVASTTTGVATGSSSMGPFARINSSLSRDYPAHGANGHDPVQAEYVVGYWKSGTTGAREFTVISTDNKADTPGGTIEGNLVFRVLQGSVNSSDGTAYNDSTPNNATAVSGISIPNLPVRVTGDDEPTRVRVLAAATEDASATEGDISDTAKFRVRLERALAAGEEITVPLRFTGATLGTNFTVALDSANSDTGVSYADTPDTAQRNSQGAVTFTGAGAQTATLEVTALSDSDTVSHRLAALVPEKSDPAKPFYFVTRDGNGAQTLAGGACAAHGCDSTQPTNRGYQMDLNEATAGITIVDDRAGWVTEGRAYDYDIRLSAAPSAGSVVVTTTVSGGSGNSPRMTRGGSLTFTTTNWAEPQTVEIATTQRYQDDPDTSFTVTHDVTSAADNAYSSLADVVYEVGIVDDDATEVSMSGPGVRRRVSSRNVSRTMLEGDPSRVDHTLSVSLGRALAEGEYVRIPVYWRAIGHSETGSEDCLADAAPPTQDGGEWTEGDIPANCAVTHSVRGPRYSANVAWPPHHNDFVLEVSGTGVSYEASNRYTPAHVGYGYLEFSGAGAQTAQFALHARAGLADIDTHDEDFYVGFFNNLTAEPNSGGFLPPVTNLGGGITEQTPGTQGWFGIADKDAASVAGTPVPVDWPLLPSGLASDSQFRLIYVTSQTTAATSSDIADYDAFVQAEITGNHLQNGGVTDLAPHASLFRAIGETTATTARDHAQFDASNPDHPNTAIYWVNGTRVAYSLAAFTDGSWDDETNPTHADGTAATINSGGYWTGSTRFGDATQASCNNSRDRLGTSRAYLGFLNDTTHPKDYRGRFPLGPNGGSSGVNENGVCRDRLATTEQRPMYALSRLFRVESTPGVTIADASAAEGSPVAFTVTLPDGYANTAGVTVPYTLADGRPVANDPAYVIATGATGGTGADYDNTSGTVTIPANATSANFTVATTNDSTYESDHYFTVTLNTPTSTGTPPPLSSAHTAIGVIEDDADAPWFQFSPATATAGEGDGTITLTVTKTGTTLVPASVYWTTADGTANNAATHPDDYTADAGYLQFAPGDSSKTVTIDIVDDSTAESAEIFKAQLSQPSDAQIGSASEATVTVTDDDGDTGPSDVTADLSVSGGGAVAEGGTLTVTVTLSGAAPSALSIPVQVASSPAATASAGDYTLPSPVTVAMGDTSGTLTFTAVDDMVDEDAETLTLELGTLPAGVTAGSTTSVAVTISDDDTAGVTVVESGGSTVVAENGGTDTYTVKLDSEPLSNVVVRAVAPAGVQIDGPAAGRAWVSQLDLTFTPSNWGTAQTVTVRGQDDDIDNAGDKRDVTIAQSVHTGDTGGKYTSGTSVADVEVDVTDDSDAAAVVVVQSGGDTVVPEDQSSTDSYTVRLGSEPLNDVVVTATAPAGAEVSVDGGSSWGSSRDLTFNPSGSGIWSTAQTVTVRGVQDVIDNPNDRRDVTITHSITSGNGDGSRYTTSTPSMPSVPVRVNDDDAKPTHIRLSTNTSTVSEGTASTTVTVTATVQGATRFGVAKTVAVSVAAANADTASANYVDMTAVADFSITIPAGALRATGSFTIAPDDDVVDEQDNSVSVTGAVSGDSSVTVNPATAIALTDDDAAPTGITLSAGPLSVTENGGARTISVTATVDGTKRFGTAQTVAVSVAGHDSAGRVGFAQVSGFDITIPAEAASAQNSFTLTPDDNVWFEGDGEASISGTSSVTVSGASVAVTNDDAEPSGVTLSVSPVSLSEGGGARTVTVTATVNGSTRYGTVKSITVSQAGSGNAAAVDYTATSPAAISLAAGAASGTTTFVVTPTDDSTDEFDETIAVSGSGAGIAAVAAASVLLTDDDDTTVSMSASAVAVAENGGVADVTLSLSRALVSGETVTVPLDVVGVSAGSDYTLGLHPASQAGVALSVSGSDSAQAPRVVLTAGASSAVLRFAAVDDSARTQPYALVRYGAGARAPSGSGVDLAAPSDGPVGWVVTDDETGDVVVPQSWALAPSGVLGQGEPRFRLVFVTSAERDASSGDIAEYDAFVRGLLAEGHADVVPYAGFFTVLGSTSGVHLRDHASVSGSATMPFYWLGETGDATKRVATDNGQFRGEWIATETPSSQSVPRDESGTVVSVDGDGYFTGSTAAGARSSSPLGSANVTVGYLNDSGAGRAPLGSGQTAAGTAVRRFYGLSPTFVRASDPVVSVTATQTSVAEGTVLSFAVSADSAPSGALTVRLFVSEEDGRDMVPDAQEGLKTVSFAAGDTSKTYTVTTTGDSTDEADSVVTVQVLANTGYTVSPTADTATVAVADNDAMTVSVSGGGGTVSEGSSLDYTVDPGRGLAAGETVTVNFAPAGTATQGDDYTITCHGAGVSCAGLAGAAPVLTITGGSGVRNAVIRVSAQTDTVHPETGETAGISLRAGHAGTGSGGTFSVTGAPSTFTIASAAPVGEVEVPANWALIPSGLSGGDSFRLLFVSSTKRDASSTDIADYNSFVQARAAAGHAALASHSSAFRAVASTASVDARDNTSTTGTGVPVYWVGGQKVADDYADFYDASWDSCAARDESGGSVALPNLDANLASAIWTGTNHDGTAETARALGTATPRVAILAESCDSRYSATAFPLRFQFTTGTKAKTSNRYLYGLSPVFEVAGTADPQASFAAAAASVAESVGTHSVTVSLSPAPTANVTVSYSLSGTAVRGSDYSISGVTSNSGTVVVGPSGSASIPVVITDDSTVENAETIVLTLTDGTGYRVGSVGVHTATISDNDTVGVPELSIAAGSAAVVEGTAATFTVSASPAAASAVTVRYTVSQSGQFVASGQLGMGKSQTLTGAGATITVPTQADSTDEADGSVTVTLTGGTGYTVGSPAAATVTVTDNDVPQAQFALASASAAESAGTRNVRVNLSPVPYQNLTISYTVGGNAARNTDYTVPSTVQATAGSAFVDIPVAITDDSTVENAETIVLTLTAGGGYGVGSVAVHTLTITDDDTAAVPVADFASASSTAAESAGTRNVAVRLVPAPSQSVTVAYTLSGTAVRGSDYTISGVTSSSGTVTVGPSGTATIPVAIADDSSAESAETVVLTLGGGSGYTVGTAAPVHTLTISDNDTAGLPVVSWYSAASRAHEHDIARYPSFTISPAPQAPLTVRFAVDANASTAALGADYRITWQHPYTLHDNDRDGIWEGAITAPVTAPAYGYWRLPTLRFVDDRVRERDETIVMRLLDGAGYTLGAIAAYTVTIADNESGPLPPPPPPPAPQVTVTAGPAVDEGGHAVFTIAASPPAAGTVSVRYTVTQNGQFVASGQLGSGKTRSLSGAAATISVPTLNDSTDEADGSVTVTLTAGSGYVVGSPSSATVTVRDDDVPTAQFAAASSTAAESAGTRNVTVRLVPAPAQSTAVSYALSGSAVRGSDYTISGVTSNTGTVTVGTSGTATIPVAVTDDSAPESAETVILTLTGGAGYDLGARRAHTLTITDNDTAGVPRVSVAAGPAVDEGGNATFTVSASPAPAGTVSVRYTVTQNGQYLTSGQLGSGRTRTLSGAAATISVPTHNDGADEADGSVTVTLTGGSGYVVGSPAAATVTVRDDDVPTAQFAAAASSADESSGIRQVRVSLSPAPHRGITVAYTIGGTATRGSDYTAAGSVSAPAGAAFVDIPVTVIDDSRQEPDKTVTLTLTGGAGYQVGARSTHTLTITDQDVSPAAAFATAADQAAENAGTHQVTLTVQPAPAAPVTVRYTISGTATRSIDYTAPSGTVTVAAGAAAAAIYIPVTDDTANEGDETVTLTLSAPGGGAGYVLGSPTVFTLTIADDDTTPATPRVSFVHESSSVSEHDVARYPSFAISPAPPAPITVRFAIDANASTATLGADYQITSNRPYTLHDDDRDGIWEGTITAPTAAPAYGYWRLPTIRFVNDRTREPAETIVLRLLNGPGYTLGDNPAYTITITD